MDWWRAEGVVTGWVVVEGPETAGLWAPVPEVVFSFEAVGLAIVCRMVSWGGLLGALEDDA